MVLPGMPPTNVMRNTLPESDRGATRPEPDDLLTEHASLRARRGAFRRAVVVAVLAIVGAALVGALLSLLVPTRYTAEARLVVGEQTVSAQSVPGYATATQQLASTYARLMQGDEVQQSLNALNLESGAASVSASPIPDSSVIRVEAQGSTREDAVEAANTSAAALIAVVSEVRGPDSTFERVRAEYVEAQQELYEAQGMVEALAALSDNAVVGSAEADDLTRQLAVATADASAAELRAAALGSAYQERIRATVSTSSSIEVLQGAVVTQSTVSQNALLGGFVAAALVGLAIGVRLSRRGPWPRDV